MMSDPQWFNLSRFMLVGIILAALPIEHVQAGNQVFGRSVGGIIVSADGVVRQATVQEKAEFLKRLKQDTEKVAPELNLPVELRKVSLRGIEAAIQDALANHHGQLPDAVKYLAGIQRIQYIFVYPEQQDIVLAGPGEGWKVDDNANVVGVTTGRPVLRLDDLLIALRTVEASRTEGISVSIDPTAEGRRKFNDVLKKQTSFTRTAVEQLALALGPQEVTFTGIPSNSHFGRILLAADHLMKRLAMNFEEAPINGLPSYLDMLKSKRQLPGSAMPRWWMACNYQPLARSEDRLAWELRGPGVKTMTEDEIVAADGTVQGAGQADPLAKQWADLMTTKYQELADRDPVFAELRNLMDLCVVAALIKQEDLCGLAGGATFSEMSNSKSDYQFEEWFAPQAIPTQCSFLKIGRNYVITASGGVQIEAWQVAENQQVSDEVKGAYGISAARDNAGWWWN